MFANLGGRCTVIYFYKLSKSLEIFFSIINFFIVSAFIFSIILHILLMLAGAVVEQLEKMFSGLVL
jgi:hypothetical protein